MGKLKFKLRKKVKGVRGRITSSVTKKNIRSVSKNLDRGLKQTLVRGRKAVRTRQKFGKRIRSTVKKSSSEFRRSLKGSGQFGNILNIDESFNKRAEQNIEGFEEIAKMNIPRKRKS